MNILKEFKNKYEQVCKIEKDNKILREHLNASLKLNDQLVVNMESLYEEI